MSCCWRHILEHNAREQNKWEFTLIALCADLGRAGFLATVLHNPRKPWLPLLVVRKRRRLR